MTFGALTAYCEPPHRTNIDLVAPKSSETVLDSSDVAAGSQQASAEDEEQNLEAKHNQHQLHLRYHRCFEKLSWATLGYFYDWTQRRYHEDDCSPFPTNLAALGRVFAQLSLFGYREKGVMGGHRDELELALDKPIVSISLGRSAVFVLGGKTLQDGPIIPMIVRSGDVIVLGGDAWLNYHSMARLLPRTFPTRHR
jgi:DNA alkylation damage repair protein AlkB